MVDIRRALAACAFWCVMRATRRRAAVLPNEAAPKSPFEKSPPYDSSAQQSSEIECDKAALEASRICAVLAFETKCVRVGAELFKRRSSSLAILILVASVGVGGCEVGPDYIQPWTTVPIRYKELKGWKIVQPIDELDRGAWWSMYHDEVLDRLERQVDVSNQNLAAAEAAFRQAVALVQEARAALFPVFGETYSGFRSHQGPAVAGGTGFTRTTVTLETTASWDLDVWGKIRRTIESNAANAQASAADIANARLSAQAQLAVAYFNMRAADSLQRILNKLAQEFRRAQTITENQYKQGTVSAYDVAIASAQVRSTEAEAVGVGVQRAQFEHAIAMLIGVPPAELSIAPTGLRREVPAVPPDLPSRLLERRPDIAAAERLIEAESALIGVASAAYFPDITVSGFFGWVGSKAFPISVANEVWQIGGTATEILFDGGLRRADVEAAEASYYQAVANYRQTVLTAFQQVEDALSSLRILAHEAPLQDDAVRYSRKAVTITINEYKAGTMSFTAVVTAEQTLLSNEQTAVGILQNRFVASVNLVQALGGGWSVNELPDYEQLRHWQSCVDVVGAIRGNVDTELPPCL
jgi:NodT family efflux transporter outer membrane factor (OMF) lipoprotein